MEIASPEMLLDGHKPFVSVIELDALAMRKSLKCLKLTFVFMCQVVEN